MACEPFTALGEYLTAGEAEGLAALLEAGEHTVHALGWVSPARRDHAAELIKRAGLGHEQPALSVAVLRAIAGAKSVHHELVPVWTMPGNEATVGHLTSEFHRVVTGARVSVTCATYNFSPSSNMWKALRAASEQPGVTVVVYVDAEMGDPLGQAAAGHGLPFRLASRREADRQPHKVHRHRPPDRAADECELLLQRRELECRVRAVDPGQRAGSVDREDHGEQARIAVRACVRMTLDAYGG